MSSPNFYVLTQVIVDDISIEGELLYKNTLGGGIYTVAGMRTWSDKVGMCSGVGKDFDAEYSQWFLDNNIDTQGLIVKHEKTAHSLVNYFSDGEREEISMPDTGSLGLMQLQADEIPASYDAAKGMYFFKDLDDSFWNGISGYLRDSSMVSVWEIFGASADYKNRDTISDYLKSVDLFSLNLTEGKNLTQKDEPIDILKDIIDMGGKNTIFRLGEKGALTTDGTNIWHVPAVKTKVVDVTGGGNSSTGGYLVGWEQSDGDPVKAACCASVAASFIIQQYGPPKSYSDDLKEEANRRLSALEKQVSRII